MSHVFLGNICDAQNLDRLTQNGITHILNCTPDLPCFWENKHEYMRIDVLDLPSQNIRKHFDQAIDFIGEFLLPNVSFCFYLNVNLDNAIRSKDNNVLVHCSAGISRSPTLVLAYMMKKNHWTLDEAFDKMRKLRQIVDPNVSFIIQLREWEKSIMLTTTEMNDDNSGANNSTTTRPTSNTYCGSSSKNKTDTKPHTDSAIIVN